MLISKGCIRDKLNDEMKLNQIGSVPWGTLEIGALVGIVGLLEPNFVGFRDG